MDTQKMVDTRIEKAGTRLRTNDYVRVPTLENTPGLSHYEWQVKLVDPDSQRVLLEGASTLPYTKEGQPPFRHAVMPEQDCIIISCAGER